MWSRLQLGLWMKWSQVTSLDANRVPRLTPSAWAARKCLCHRARPSASWDGNSSEWMTRFAERSNGFKPMDTPNRKVALVAALEREVWPLVKHWTVCDREFDGRQFRFSENDRAVLVCGG